MLGGQVHAMHNTQCNNPTAHKESGERGEAQGQERIAHILFFPEFISLGKAEVEPHWETDKPNKPNSPSLTGSGQQTTH